MEFFTELSDLDCEQISGGQAYSPNGSTAPGQVNATANADALLIKQQEKFGDLQNGVKAGNTAPNNANHFFQQSGIIG